MKLSGMNLIQCLHKQPFADSGRVVTGRYDEEKVEDALSKALREEAERMQNGELSE